MSLLRHSLITVICFLLAGCSNAVPKEQASTDIRPAKGQPVPKEILGRWEYVGEECEEGETPSKERREFIIRFHPNFRYEMYVEGWTFFGKYVVERFQDETVRVQFEETLYNFNLVKGRLENWSEGDAVYLCGRMFEKTEV